MPVVSDKYKKEKKAAILKSAFECFAEKGFQAATIDDIVAHSNISKGAIYNYFNSKDDIYIELMNQTTNENISTINNMLASLPTAREKIDYFFKVYSQLYRNPNYVNSTRVHIEFWLYSSRKSDLRELLITWYQVYKDLFQQIIVEGKQSGEIHSSVNPEELSLIFWGLIDGVAIHYAVLLDDYPYEKIYKEIKEMIYSKLAFTN